MNILYNCSTVAQDDDDMECPHLCENNGSKHCKRMKDKGNDGEVSDFDVKHYCQGNPFYCYFFRISETPKSLGS